MDGTLGRPGCISRVGVGARRWHGLGRGKGEQAAMFSFPFYGDLGLCNFRVSGRDGDRPNWKMEPETGRGYTSREGPDEI